MDARQVRRGAAGTRLGVALAAVVVVTSVLTVPGTSIPKSSEASVSLSTTSDHMARAVRTDAGLSRDSSPLNSYTAPPFSFASAGRVTRTIFPGYNTSLPGSFTSSVATWLVGTPIYVPPTNALWFPQRAVPVPGDPVPTIAPVAVFNLSSDQFDGFVTNLSNTSALAYDPSNGDVYATLPASNSVVVVDPVTRAIVGSPITVGSGPDALAFDSNSNLLFVANSVTSNLTAIDTLSERVSVASVAVGTDPLSLAFDPLDEMIFVANGGSKWISVINATDPTVPLSVPKIYLAYGTASNLAYSPETDTTVASVPASPYATILGVSSSIPAAITQVAPVGFGVVPAVASANGTEFALGNSSGGDVVVLNATVGTPVGSRIPVQGNATELAVNPVSGLVFCWASVSRVLQSVNLSTRSAGPIAHTTFPEISSMSFAIGSPGVYASALNGSAVYSLNSTSLGLFARVVTTTPPPLSIAVDPSANRIFVGTTNGLAIYSTSSDQLLGTVVGLFGNCNRLLLDRAENLLWLSNGISGVVAVNLTTLNVVISTSLVIPASASNGIAVDPLESETFVLTSTSAVTVLDSHTGIQIGSAIPIGSNDTSLAFDPVDGQVYVAGDEVSLLDAATLDVDGTLPFFGGTHRDLQESYDPSRDAIYLAIVGLLPASQGAIISIDGSSIAASAASSVEIPVGEDPAAFGVVPSIGGNASGLAMIWVANELSGTISIVSTPPEITFFAATPSTVDLGYSTSLSLAFTGGGGVVTVSFAGLPGGCSASSAPEWNCTPTIPGDYHITVNVTDSLGGTANATTTLAVLVALALHTSFSPRTLPEIDVGVPVVGTAVASNGLSPYVYSWSFGDGTVASGPTTSHAYLSPGSYVVTADVRDGTGASATNSSVVTVVPRPSSDVIAVRGNATDVDFPISFTATVTGGTGVGEGSWAFGDGTEALGPNATHAWTRIGVFTVTFHYVDALGVAANASINVTVHSPLTASFSSGNTSSSGPAAPATPVTFSSSASGGTPPYVVSWSFGDGSNASGAVVIHSYAAAGTYRVGVSLVDAVGATVRTNLSVVVASPATSSSTITSMGGGFGSGLFLGLILGGVIAAVVLFFAGSRKGERTPPAPVSPYVPP